MFSKAIALSARVVRRSKPVKIHALKRCKSNFAFLSAVSLAPLSSLKYSVLNHAVNHRRFSQTKAHRNTTTIDSVGSHAAIQLECIEATPLETIVFGLSYLSAQPKAKLTFGAQIKSAWYEDGDGSPKPGDGGSGEKAQAAWYDDKDGGDEKDGGGDDEKADKYVLSPWYEDGDAETDGYPKSEEPGTDGGTKAAWYEDDKDGSKDGSDGDGDGKAGEKTDKMRLHFSSDNHGIQLQTYVLSPWYEDGDAETDGYPKSEEPGTDGGTKAAWYDDKDGDSKGGDSGDADNKGDEKADKFNWV